MNRKDTCSQKRAYDTEFEAIVTMRRLEKRWGVDLMPYQCEKHWHIANEKPALRGKHIYAEADYYCKPCKQPMRLKNLDKHQRKLGHIRQMQKERDRG